MCIKTLKLFMGLLALNLLISAGLALPVAAAGPVATVTPPATPSSADVETLPSPDGRWTATINHTAHSLELSGGQQVYPVFPAGSGVETAVWSPDSDRLLVVQPYQTAGPRQGNSIPQPVAVWQVPVTRSVALTPTQLYQASRSDFERDGVQQAEFGAWSPNRRYVVMWTGIRSASILADGLPPQVLDTATGQTYPAAVSLANAAFTTDTTFTNTALINPRYQSWSPDSSVLAITVGGYRSAQVNKWLNLVNVATGQTTTVISMTEQVPGAVAWSPQGNVIAYAAVDAAKTGDYWADQSTFDNPAIAGRRIYLLDPVTGQRHRLNNVEAYQDAPVWSADGTRLYYAQRNGTNLDLMVADPATGQAVAVPNARQPATADEGLVGYYGQFGHDDLLKQIPAQ